MPRRTCEEPMEPPVAPCSDRPTPLSVNPDGIPQEFKDHDSWVVWKYESRGGLWTKPPYRADQPHQKADSTKPDTWCPYRTALASYEEGKAEGIGFIPVKGLVGIDLDHCRNPQTGEIDLPAMRIVDQAKSHTEITVSGEGLRIFLRARLTTTRRRSERLEIYPGGGGRYFTTTGVHLKGTPTTIESRQGELEAICSEYLPEPTSSSRSRSTKTAPQHVGASVSFNDAELITLARDAKNGDAFSRLWVGDTSGYDSHSEADLALASHLAFRTDRDPSRMDSLFRMSGLMRDKWDEPHGEHTYGDRTITKAISTSTGNADGYQAQYTNKAELRPARELRLLNDVEIVNQKPPAFQIDQITVENTLCCLYGHPGVGKTFGIATYGCSLATGTAFFGHEVPRRGPFVHVLAEGALGFGPRLYAWKRAFGFSTNTVIGYHIVPDAVNLLDPSAVKRLIELIAPLEPSGIGFDTLARCMVGGDENSASDMGRALDAADRVRRSTGAVVLLTHHTNKDQRYERGSSALRGGVDTMLSMDNVDDTIRLSCTKQKNAAEFDPISLKLVPTEDGNSCVLREASQITRTAELSRTQARLLAALRSGATTHGLTTQEWRASVPDVIERTYHAARNRLIDLGYVAEHGQYFSWTGKEPPRGRR